MFVKVVQETASKAVSETVHQIEISQRKAKENQKQQLISSLTQELCEAFFKEQIYLNVLEAKAKVYRNQSLKKFTISRIKLRASESLKKQINVRSKKTELLNFTNNVVPLFAPPHKSSFPLYPTSPLITQGTPSFDTFDFSKLLSGLKKSGLNINGTVIVSDADSVQSEWLLGKLGLAKVPGKQIEGSYNEEDFHLQLSGFPSFSDVFNHTLLEYSLFVVQISLEGSDNAAAALQTLDSNAKFLSGLIDYVQRNATVPSVSLVVLFCGSSVLPLSDARISTILNINGKKSSNSKISTSLLILPPFVTSTGSIDWKLVDHKLFNTLHSAFQQIVPANTLPLDLITKEQIEELPVSETKPQPDLISQDQSKANNTSVSSIASNASTRSKLEYLRSNISSSHSHSRSSSKSGFRWRKRKFSAFELERSINYGSNGNSFMSLNSNAGTTMHSFMSGTGTAVGNSSFGSLTTEKEADLISKRKRRLDELMKLTEGI
ncbi:unnamed protein product [Ambrosiozyma monospora]|uniref:Unnamed protein product n=1 Tax=Ambrosiozyma monospora TaxID=43982 RepID=A0ACB5SW15_AMBMO|nr:unnamed protein product [Ambrosiozyma monospora]